MEKRALTIEEAGKVLGVSRSTIYRLIEDEELVSIQIRSARRIPVDAIDNYLKKLADESRRARS